MDDKAVDFLRHVNPENYFFLQNGFVIKSLPELAGIIEQVDEGVFNHHVTSERNDFANWIESTVGDVVLKNKILNVDNKAQFLGIINKRIEEIKLNIDNPDYPELTTFLDTDDDIKFDMPAEGELLNSFLVSAEAGDATTTNADTATQPAPTETPAAVQPAAEAPAVEAPPDVAPDLPPDTPPDVPPDTPPETGAVQTEAPPAEPVAEVPVEQPAPVEPAPAAETPPDTAPVEETPAETPAEVPPDTAPVEAAPAAETPVETPPDIAPVEPSPTETPAEPAPIEPTPETPAEQPTEGAPAEESATANLPTEEKPAEEAPAEEKKEEEPVEEVPEEPAEEKKEEEPEEKPTEENAEEQPKEKNPEEEKKEEVPTDKELSEETKEESKEEETKEKKEDNTEEEKKEEPNEEEKVEDKKEETPQEEETIEIREIQKFPVGIPELDSVFKHGIPKICNILFVGEMSSGKTMTALNLILSKAKKGQKALYVSFQDSEEKIINVMKGVDEKILDYINSDNIMIKKLDPFDIAKVVHIKEGEHDLINLGNTMNFVEEFNPDLIVMDSLSTLELSFSEGKSGYREYVDDLFKYFEKKDVIAVFIKELKKGEEIDKEFFENILADIILHFKRGNGKNKLSLIKDYPIKTAEEKRGFFSFLKRKNKK